METLSDTEAQSALWEEGVVLGETCAHPLDGSGQGALSGVCPTPGVCLGPPRDTLLGLCTWVLSVRQLKHHIVSFWTNWSQNHPTLRMSLWTAASSAGTW